MSHALARVNWNVEAQDNPGHARSVEHAQLAVLMDIREQLVRLNGLLSCSNFLQIPWVLQEIRRNTKRKKRKRAVLKRAA